VANSRYILCLFILDTGWDWWGSLSNCITSSTFVQNTGTYWMGGYLGPTADLGFVLKRKSGMWCCRESNPERSLPNSKYFCALDVRVEHTLSFPTYYFSSLLTRVSRRVPFILLHPVIFLLLHPFPLASQYLFLPYHNYIIPLNKCHCYFFVVIPVLFS